MATVFHSGKVLDQYGLPLFGAHVVLASNSMVGTTTNFDGNFQVQGNEGDQYTIGHLGKKSARVTLKKGMQAATYKLQDDAFVLDEFVGTPKKKSNYGLALLAFGAAIFIGNKIFG